VNYFPRSRTFTTDPLTFAIGVVLVMTFPALLVLPIAARLFARWKSRVGHRGERVRTSSDVSTVARILLVGLTGGLPLPASLEMAVSEVGPIVANELTLVLRAAKREGMAPSLAVSPGSCTRPLFSRLALAQASGAPMVDGVAAYLSEMRSVRRAEALERARRLPVTLMIPLGLLILPGFVVLFVGPIIFTSLSQLFGSLP
jgi:type II secretory pathway component PulF